MKQKSLYRCQECQSTTQKWLGKCTDCGAWNSYKEELAGALLAADGGKNRYGGYAQRSELVPLGKVERDEFPRITSGSQELDRVLGGGFVQGSVSLIGGDPGIGKSTLLLQTMGVLAKSGSVIYISGEESNSQIAQRAERLGVAGAGIELLAESNLESIMEMLNRHKPRFAVVDSIQTVFSSQMQSAPGSVPQIRESASQLARIAKANNITLCLVGHVTKDGELAGPRVLEHIVDVVMYFQGDEHANFRLLRAEKNRFGAANEIGVFSMTEEGLKDVLDPSLVFLGQDRTPAIGSCITVTQEGTRGLVVELQALVDVSKNPNPRRLAVGVDPQRLSMLLAVLNKTCHIQTYDCDVFVNVVGGLKLDDPAVDLAIMMGVVSSLKEKPLPEGVFVFGEVDLTGKVRAVSRGQERLKEAEKLGFKRVIVPEGNQPKKQTGLEVYPVKNVSQVLALLKEWG